MPPEPGAGEGVRGAWRPAGLPPAACDALVRRLLAAGPSDDPALHAALARWAEAAPSAGAAVRALGELRRLLPAGFDRRIDEVTAEAVRLVAERLVDAALVDPVTGLSPRRTFETDLARWAAAAARSRRPLTVVILDLDGLKAINDAGGHAAGDNALAALGRAIRSALRGSDTGYRVGGDEFALLLPDTAATEAGPVLDRLAAADAPGFSWGLAECPADGTDPARLVRLADADLYRRRRTHRAGRPAAAAVRRRRHRHLLRGPARLGAAFALGALVAGGATGAWLGAGDAGSRQHAGHRPAAVGPAAPLVAAPHRPGRPGATPSTDAAPGPRPGAATTAAAAPPAAPAAAAAGLPLPRLTLPASPVPTPSAPSLLQSVGSAVGGLLHTAVCLLGCG